MNTGRYLVIIPAFNEEKTISRVIKEIKAIEPLIDIVVVDDGSTDNTAYLAQKAGATVLSHAVNLGYGAALQTGYKYAVLNDYKLVIQMDGDGQHDPKYLPNLISSIENDKFDVAIGSRFLGKLRKYKIDPLRRIGMAFFRVLLYLVIRKKITDPTSGYQALSNNVFKFFAQGSHFPMDYPDADMVILLHRLGFKIAEVPVVMYENSTGRSMHSGLKPAYYIIKMLLSIFTVIFGEYRKFMRR